MRPATAPLNSSVVGSRCDHTGADADADEASPSPVAHVRSAAPHDPSGHARLRALLDNHFDFVWRSLRRLGVATSSVDDAAQRVFWVVAKRLELIEAGRERAYLFGVATRVASDWRRANFRRREVQSDDEFNELPHASPVPEDLLDQKRARETLDALLDQLPLELRTVLVLIEGEGLKAHEAADILGVPEGTVSSRLRRARAALAESVHRLKKRNESRRGRPT